MQNKRKENALRTLTSLYTVVIGVALSSSILKLIDSDIGLASVETQSLLLFIAFIITLFPFYHGALRHLDDAYIENDSSHIKDGALMIDFLLLFFHGMAFVVLSLMLKKPGDFALVLISVLSIDVIWGAFTYFGSSAKGSVAEGRWLLINVATVLISGICIPVFGLDMLSLTNEVSYKVAWVIFGVAIVRTFADYASCWKFYFPSPENE